MSNPFQNKLLIYEVHPPEGVWNKIAENLDENISVTVSEKLYGYAETPSPRVWKDINSQLESSVSEKARVIPFFVRYRRPLKYSGAVAIFAFLAMLTSLFISKKTASELPAQTILPVNIKKDSPGISTETMNNTTTQLIQKNKSTRLSAKSKVPEIKSEDVEVSNALDENFLPRVAERNEIVSPSLSPDKYMIYSDGNGNVIRLPKKIFSAFACPVNDFVCKQRLQQLREKFAASAMTADFTGLLQILKSLQENQ